MGAAEQYNYFRDYDRSLGRYIQSDPIGLQGGPNPFAYVEGNPVSWFDSNGLSKGGKQNLNTEGFTKKSDPAEVEKAMKDAKASGSQPRYRALRALLKVIKRGGTLGLACELLDDFLKCQEDPCSCDPLGVACMADSMSS